MEGCEGGWATSLGGGEEKKRKWSSQRKGEETCWRGSEQVLRLGTLPLQGVFRAVTEAGAQPPILSRARPMGTSPAVWCFFIFFSCGSPTLQGVRRGHLQASHSLALSREMATLPHGDPNFHFSDEETIM